jgi:3'-phosphoadenosine 5'-phosphosulfate sulfotransferase (PAPS reductase)/FAD synthetase
MAWEIKRRYSGAYQIIFGFANTGKEREETLVFVDRCDREWGLNLVWVEALVNHDQRKSSGHKIVSFETAARNGEPFEEVIKKYGIPNKPFPHCTRELKRNALQSYLLRENQNQKKPNKGCVKRLRQELQNISQPYRH